MTPRMDLNGATAPAPGVPSGYVPPVDDDLPEIEIVRGQLPRMVRQTLEALAEHDENVFQRLGELVTIARQPDRAEVRFCPGRESIATPCLVCAVDSGHGCVRNTRTGSSITVRPGTPVVRPLGPTLTLRAARCANWVRWDSKAGEKVGKEKPAGEMVDADPDRQTMVQILGLDDLYPVPPLQGVIETPTLTPSGRVVSKAGYDRETAFFMLPAFEIEPIPERPTRAQAEEALSYLWREMYSDFPFADVGDPDPSDRDRVKHYEKARAVPGAFVGLASILTIFSRLAIDGAVPGFIFEAATPGSGKSLHMHITSMVTTGRPAGVTTFPMRGNDPNEEELEKILSGYALGGARMIAFDNITGNLCGAALDKVLTAERTISLRKLGESPMLDMPWATVTMFSGNNMTTSPDVAGRCMVSRIVSSVENPRGRPASDFRHPYILSWIRDNLSKIVRAAFVVLRAFWAATDKPDCGLRGSFFAWSRIVPGAIKYAGGPNVIDAWAESSGGASGGDEMSAAHLTLMTAWPFDVETKAHAVLSKAFEHEFEIQRGAAPDGLEDLREAIRTICKVPSLVPKASVFGAALGKLRDKIRSGMTIQRRIDRTGTAWWTIKRSAPRAAPVAASPPAVERPTSTPTIHVCASCQSIVGRGPGFCNPCPTCRGCVEVPADAAGACYCRAPDD